MMGFEYNALPWNIIFGAGTVKKLPAELKKRGYSKVLILSTPGQKENANKVIKILGAQVIGLFDKAKMHVPMKTVESAALMAAELDADCTVSIGGGSTTGLGKALSLKYNLPNIAIPTTYAGSEMTNIWGITEENRKVTGRDDVVVPRQIIYDPELTLTLPASIVGPSGLNAMAQAVVNIATDMPNPIVSSMACEAIKFISTYLPKIISDPTDIDARAHVLYGASMAGAALGTGTTSLHHKLCHTFGGTFNTPHAETHAILLPHSVAYNARVTSIGTNKIAEIMQVKNAAIGIHELAKKVGSPTSLKEIGIKKEDLDKAVTVAMEMSINNPEPVTADRLRQLLENAYHGHVPSAC